LPPVNLVQRLLARVNSGDIILLHDGRGDRSATIEALPFILEGLRKKGLRPVTLPELMENRSARVNRHQTSL